MAAIGQFFMFIALVIPIVLIAWYTLSSLGRITRVVEDIAITLRRIEQSGRGSDPLQGA